MPDLWGSKLFQTDPVKAPISAAINHIVDGTTASAIRRATGEQYIVLQAEVGDWRIRVGDHVPRAFVAGDVSIADNEITLTAHGYDTGDGPLRLAEATGTYADGLETLTFADADPDTIVRSSGTPGSFVVDGFTVGMTITVAGTASNDGIFTLATVAALTLTLVAGDALVAEGLAGAGVTITGSSLPTGIDSSTDVWVAVIDANTIALAASPGDANRIAQTGANNATVEDAIRINLTTAGAAAGNALGVTSGMVATALGATVDNGVILDAAAGNPGNRLIISARAVTVISFGASDALAHWSV